jgi:spore germination protein PD
MNIHVVNRSLQVGSIRILSISSSSMLLVGDTQSIVNSSIFDTPPESVIVGPLVPIAPEAPVGTR